MNIETQRDVEVAVVGHLLTTRLAYSQAACNYEQLYQLACSGRDATEPSFASLLNELLNKQQTGIFAVYEARRLRDRAEKFAVLTSAAYANAEERWNHMKENRPMPSDWDATMKTWLSLQKSSREAADFADRVRSAYECANRYLDCVDDFVRSVGELNRSVTATA